jgi:hypothetical protein
MKSQFRPIYNKIIRRRNLLIEKINKNESLWDGFYILEFRPNTRRKCEFLVHSENNSFPMELWGAREYSSIKIKIIDNIGKNDGREFVEWVDNFYNYKNDYYRFNIYDNDASDFCIYGIDSSMRKITKFWLSSCVMKNPIFFEYNKNNKLSPQVAITLCTKTSITISHIV